MSFPSKVMHAEEAQTDMVLDATLYIVQFWTPKVSYDKRARCDECADARQIRNRPEEKVHLLRLQHGTAFMSTNNVSNLQNVLEDYKEISDGAPETNDRYSNGKISHGKYSNGGNR